MTTDTDTGTSATEGDVVDVLAADHREFLALVTEIRASSDPAAQRELADTLIAELVRHAVAEEMWVYPAMKEHLPDGEAKVEHDTQEHKELEVLMKELEGHAPEDAEFTSCVARMEEVLRDHISDEEQEQFPELRARIPRDELLSMARRVEKAKRVAPTRPHPNAPNSELFHKTVGPGAGMVDRLRDKLFGRPLED